MARHAYSTGALNSAGTDLALLDSVDNLALLRVGLRDLNARRIAVPPFDRQFLLRGHPMHFRCYHPDALNMRIHIMSVIRDVDSSEMLWDRRTQFMDDDGQQYDVNSLHT